jgi:hypothetical protein
MRVISTAAQRRAYIDTSRRSQPIHELARKAAKAKRRYLNTWEATDLFFAKSVARDEAAREKFWIGYFCPINFCSLCGEFGRGPWNEQTKRYERNIVHKPRCEYGNDHAPYPGWSAVTSQVPSREETPSHAR